MHPATTHQFYTTERCPKGHHFWAAAPKTLPACCSRPRRAPGSSAFGHFANPMLQGRNLVALCAASCQVPDSCDDIDAGFDQLGGPIGQQIRVRRECVINDRVVLTLNKALRGHSFEERSHHYGVARCGIQNTEIRYV